MNNHTTRLIPAAISIGTPDIAATAPTAAARLAAIGNFEEGGHLPEGLGHSTSEITTVGHLSKCSLEKKPSDYKNPGFVEFL